MKYDVPSRQPNLPSGKGTVGQIQIELKLPIDSFTYVLQCEHAVKDIQALKESFRKSKQKEEKKTTSLGTQNTKSKKILKAALTLTNKPLYNSKGEARGYQTQMSTQGQNLETGI